MTADVIVAGAGPAGSIVGLLLARAGLRVRIFERAAFPRDKLCGDTINPGALAILRRLDVAGPVERAGIPVRGMLVSGRRGVRVAAEYGRDVRGVALLRRDLDRLLLDEAVAAGAAVETGVLVHEPVVREEAGRRRVAGVRVSSGGRHHVLEAPLTIAADGRRSRLAFQLGLARHPGCPRRWAIGAYFEDVAVCTGFGEMHIRPGRYVGVAPLPGGLTNTCVVVPQPRCGALADPAALLIATLQKEPELADRFAGARMVKPPTVVGPLAVDTCAAGMDGLLLAGDAAGFVDPMTGDGLRFAFAGAELAAEVACGTLDGRIMHPAEALARRRREVFGAKLRLNRVLRSLVGSAPALGWAERGASMFPFALRRLITVAGDVP